MDHLDDSTLVAFRNGAISREDWVEVNRHLGACADCQRRLDAVRTGSENVTLPARGQAGPPSAASSPSLPLPRGTCIGRYVLLEKLGAGGMGEVYIAYDPQLDRRVALKLLLPGTMEAGEARTRLLREAQAMARLSHPNVIAVHDAGTFEDRVFVAMELVDGVTLERWLGDTRGWREVLAQFLSAGRGLAAAHAAGLIHRDFKPDNVLLGRDGRVRVLDFGLARPANSPDAPPSAPRRLDGRDLTSSGAMLHSPITRAGTIMGTPAYMSPEQIEGAPTDARTDQYSFCIALFEALYGVRPFDADTFDGLLAAMHLARVPDPPRDTAVPSWVHRVLARGLSCVPDHRFPSMEALLAELSRDPDRQRRRLLAVGAAVTLVAVGIGGSALVARRQGLVCQEQEKRLAGIWDANRQQAIHDAFTATGKPFAEDTWNRAHGLLDRYASAWAAMAQQSCEASRIRGLQTEEAFALRTVCLEDRLREVRALSDLFAHADTDVVANALPAVQALQSLKECADASTLVARPELKDPAARARADQIRVRLIEAKALLDAGKYRNGVQSAWSTATEAHALGHRPLEAEAEFLLGRLQDRAGDPGAAAASLQEAIWSAEASRRDELLARAWSRLLLVESTAGHPDRNAPIARSAQAAMERLGPNEELEGDLENSLGAFSLGEGKYDDALAHFQKSLELRQRALGPDHPEVARVLNNLGTVMLRLGRYAEALACYRKALAILEAAFGPTHPNIASPLNNLGSLATRVGRPKDALAYYQRALAVREQALGPEHPEVISSVQALATAYARVGMEDEAITLNERLLAVREKIHAAVAEDPHDERFGSEDPLIAESLSTLGSLYLSRGHFERAVASLQRAEAILEKTRGPGHPSVAAALDNLGASYLGMGDLSQARVHLDRSLALWEKTSGAERVGHARCLNHLGDLLLAQHRPDQALARYQRALALREQALGAGHVHLANDLLGIGRAYLELRQPAKAVETLDRAVRLREADPAAGADGAEVRFALANALWDAGRDRERSLALAAQARAAYAGLGARYRDEVARIDQWQAQRAGGAP